MENFAKRPLISGFIIFFLILVCGTVAGFILGILVVSSRSQPVSSSDPGDGSAMAAFFIWILSFWASLILGLLAGITTSVILKRKNAREAELN